MENPPLDIWYVTDAALCNLSCPYCASGANKNKIIWGAPDGPERIQKITAWIGKLPHRVRLRMQTIGEPFLSKEHLAGAAFLSQQDNVEFVELVTNGTFSPKTFSSFSAQANIKKISLWVTCHFGEVSLEKVVEAARLAQEAGAFVVVNGIIFPDTVEHIRKMVALCKKYSLRSDVSVGNNIQDAYPGKSIIPILDTDQDALPSLFRNEAALKATLMGHFDKRHQPCSAGHDYIYIHANGDIHPCGPDPTVLGSALDPGFKLKLRRARYAPCTVPGQYCTCKEDFMHLQAAESNLKMTRSLGYYEPDAGDLVHPGDRTLDYSYETFKLDIKWRHFRSIMSALLHKIIGRQRS